MKRLVCVLLMLLVLCSCSGGEIEPRLKGISFNAEMTYYNECYNFGGEVLSDGTLKVTLTEPEELKDLSFTLSGENTVIEYKGLTYSPVEGSMPFSRIIENFYKPLREVALSNSCEVSKDGVFKSDNGAQSYTITFSPTGLPQKLEIPDERFSVRFYNVSIKEEAND